MLLPILEIPKKKNLKAKRLQVILVQFSWFLRNVED